MVRVQVRATFIALTVILLTSAAIAQGDSCGEADVLARMAKTRSVSTLKSVFGEMSESYRGHLVFAVRQFELSLKDHRAADELLSLLPKSDEQELAVYSLSGFMCQGESDSDLRQLSALADRLPRDWSSAVLIAPSHMNAYVSYAAEAVQDPHSDYAVRMQRVCRLRHAMFVDAVNSLGSGAPEKGLFATASSEWFKKHILDPSGCRPLAIPEAE